MSDKKKIIIIGPAHPLRGGIAVFNERLAEVLQEDGHEVTIYSFSLQYPNFLFPGKTQYSEDPPPTQLNIQVKVNSVNPFNWIKIGREISRMKPDIVIGRFWLPFMGPCFGTILRLIKRNKKTRIIGFVDNIIPHEKRPGDYLFAKYFVGACDAFLVMSKTVEAQLRTFTKQKPIALAEHPLSDNFGKAVNYESALAHLNLSKDFRYLLFFGFIRDYKGLDLLLEAMADERVQNLKVKLIVAGEYYSNEEKYKTQIASLGIDNQLVMATKFISNEEVKYYFCAADLITQPYKTATQSGVSSLGYFFEKPMLVTKVGGLPEIVQHDKAGYVVDVDSKSIAEAIVDFYENKRSEAFVEQVQIDKKMFSWEAMIDALLSLEK
ncbi:MAG: glycosyltransferase involved in cell wall biosynthesis [Granulosicoccus sp.]|jgi:glycosyltransferase involved in cell wall biosynthesis